MLYAYGFVLAAEPVFGRNVDRQWRRFLALGVMGISALIALAWVGAIPSRLPPASEWWALAFWTVYAVGAWSLVVAVLGLGRRYLNSDTTALERGRHAGLAWYLVHQPVIVALAAWVVTWSLGIWTKALALLLLSLAVTVAVIALLQWGKSLRSRQRPAPSAVR